MNNRNILVIDLEATCWADDDPNCVPRVRGQNYPNEIIEIGAALVDAETLKVHAEYQAFVRPKERPLLSPFCRELTHIEQADVDAARAYPAVMDEFASTFRLGTSDEPLFASWGAYDRKQFASDCERHGIAYPFTRGHMNLKDEIARRLDMKPRGINRMLHALWLEFSGTQHRALEDVRNVVRIMRAVQARTGHGFL